MSLPTINLLPLTPYGIQKIVRTSFLKLMVNMMSTKITLATPNQCPYQLSTSYTLRFQRYCPDKILKVKVTTTKSKVKSKSHHDVAHLQPPNNVPTKYQLPTPYGCRYSPD